MRLKSEHVHRRRWQNAWVALSQAHLSRPLRINSLNLNERWVNWIIHRHLTFSSQNSFQKAMGPVYGPCGTLFILHVFSLRLWSSSLSFSFVSRFPSLCFGVVVDISLHHSRPCSSFCPPVLLLFVQRPRFYFFHRCFPCLVGPPTSCRITHLLHSYVILFAHFGGSDEHQFQICYWRSLICLYLFFGAVIDLSYALVCCAPLALVSSTVVTIYVRSPVTNDVI